MERAEQAIRLLVLREFVGGVPSVRRSCVSANRQKPSSISFRVMFFTHTHAGPMSAGIGVTASSAKMRAYSARLSGELYFPT